MQNIYNLLKLLNIVSSNDVVYYRGLDLSHMDCFEHLTVDLIHLVMTELHKSLHFTTAALFASGTLRELHVACTLSVQLYGSRQAHESLSVPDNPYETIT